jgi:hypothetical protein
MNARAGYAAAAAALTAFAAFEAWNHEAPPVAFAAGAAAPALLPRAMRGSSVGPFWLGIAGFFAPRGHALQVASLGWAAHVFARRAVSAV